MSKYLTTKAKQSEVEVSKNTFYPTLDVGGLYQRVDEQTPNIAGSIYSGYAKISYDIYDGGKKSFITKQKQNELKSTQFELTAFKKSLSLQIVQKFFTVKNIDASIKALEEKNSIRCTT